MKLAWRPGPPAPEGMTSYCGSAVVDGSTAYFSSGHSVYSYSVLRDKWAKLPLSRHQYFAIAVVNGKLTTIGGESKQWRVTNELLSLSERSWKELLPRMPSNQIRPAAATTPKYLVVAGGKLANHGSLQTTVMILNLETLQWSRARRLPEAVGSPQMTLLGTQLYLIQHNNSTLSCSVEDLLKSTDSSNGQGSVWTRLASIPTQWESSLAAIRGRVLAIGGRDGDGNPTGAIYCYNMATDSWSVIGEIPNPRSRVLCATLPENQLVVVGGELSSGSYSFSTDFCSCDR